MEYQDTNDWAENVVAFWKKENIKLEEGVSEIQLFHTEKMLGMQFPQAFKVLYLKVNGFKDYDMNKDMISIWPISRIVEEYTYRRYPNFIGFGDYLINSHMYGFLIGQSGVFKYYDSLGIPPEKIADSYQEAINLINTNSDLLY